MLEICLFVAGYSSSKWAKITYNHCNFSCGCPPAKMASKTMKRGIITKMNFLVDIIVFNPAVHNLAIARLRLQGHNITVHPPRKN